MPDRNSIVVGIKHESVLNLREHSEWETRMIVREGLHLVIAQLRIPSHKVFGVQPITYNVYFMPVTVLKGR